MRRFTSLQCVYKPRRAEAKLDGKEQAIQLIIDSYLTGGYFLFRINKPCAAIGALSSGPPVPKSPGMCTPGAWMDMGRETISSVHSKEEGKKRRPFLFFLPQRIGWNLKRSSNFCRSHQRKYLKYRIALHTPLQIWVRSWPTKCRAPKRFVHTHIHTPTMHSNISSKFVFPQQGLSSQMPPLLASVGPWCLGGVGALIQGVCSQHVRNLRQRKIGYEKLEQVELTEVTLTS